MDNYYDSINNFTLFDTFNLVLRETIELIVTREDESDIPLAYIDVVGKFIFQSTNSCSIILYVSKPQAQSSSGSPT